MSVIRCNATNIIHIIIMARPIPLQPVQHQSMTCLIVVCSYYYLSTYIFSGHVATLHNVALRSVEINPGQFDAAVFGLRHEVGNWIADGELNDEVGIVRELLHFGRHWR